MEFASVCMYSLTNDNVKSIRWQHVWNDRINSRHRNVYSLRHFTYSSCSPSANGMCVSLGYGYIKRTNKYSLFDNVRTLTFTFFRSRSFRIGTIVGLNLLSFGAPDWMAPFQPFTWFGFFFISPFSFYFRRQLNYMYFLGSRWNRKTLNDISTNSKIIPFLLFDNWWIEWNEPWEFLFH